MKEILFAASLLFLSVDAMSADMHDTNYVNQSIGDMVASNQAAFISSCIAHSGTKGYGVTLIYFPRKDKGLFILSDQNHVVLNSGDVSWTEKGQWDVGELEGGVETVKIMNDLFSQVTRLPFLWVSPNKVKSVMAEMPKNSCKMLKN